MTFILVLFFASCASSDDIFPEVSLNTAEGEAVLPNPINLVVDAANNQVVVANSNVDVFFDSGSIAVLSVDATTTTAPNLAITSIISAPNFAGEMVFDGASGLFVNFRETFSGDDKKDILGKFTLGAGSIVSGVAVGVEPDPYGMDLAGTNIYVVADNTLEVFNTDLTKLANIDLTTAEEAEIEDTDADHVEDVVIDQVHNLAIVSNRGGMPFIVDLATNTLVQVIEGPASTRSLLISGSTLFVLDGLTTTVWVFNMDLLAAAVTVPEAVNDSSFLMTTVNVGNDPNGMVLDAVNNHLYVANTFDDSISVIDTLSFSEILRRPVGEDDVPSTFNRFCDEPFGLDLGTFNGTQYLFVTCFKSSALLMMSTGNMQPVEIFPNTEDT